MRDGYDLGARVAELAQAARLNRAARKSIAGSSPAPGTYAAAARYRVRSDAVHGSFLAQTRQP